MLYFCTLKVLVPWIELLMLPSKVLTQLKHCKSELFRVPTTTGSCSPVGAGVKEAQIGRPEGGPLGSTGTELAWR